MIFDCNYSPSHRLQFSCTHCLCNAREDAFETKLCFGIDWSYCLDIPWRRFAKTTHRDVTSQISGIKSPMHSVVIPPRSLPQLLNISFSVRYLLSSFHSFSLLLSWPLPWRSKIRVSIPFTTNVRRPSTCTSLVQKRAQFGQMASSSRLSVLVQAISLLTLMVEVKMLIERFMLASTM